MKQAPTACSIRALQTHQLLPGSLVCRVYAAAVRARPDDAAEQVTQALAGEPLTVDETRGDWALIWTAYDYPGWIRTAALGQVRGTVPRTWLPEPRPDGDPVTEARAYVGAPYEWGGMTERGIDCSGLVHMAYRRVGPGTLQFRNGNSGLDRRRGGTLVSRVTDL